MTTSPVTPWKKLCCAVDLSEPSRAALEQSADLARQLGAELTLLHVYEPHAPSPELLLQRLEEASPDLERQLEGWRARAEAQAGRAVRVVLLTGNPAPEIVRFAAAGGFDLVVLATHGRTGLARVLMGSVAEHVVRHAHGPVLVVRRPPAS